MGYGGMSGFLMRKRKFHITILVTITYRKSQRTKYVFTYFYINSKKIEEKKKMFFFVSMYDKTKVNCNLESK